MLNSSNSTYPEVENLILNQCLDLRLHLTKVMLLLDFPVSIKSKACFYFFKLINLYIFFYLAIVDIGSASFKYDMRRLTEILAFPRAWYRRSIVRRLFLGDLTRTVPSSVYSDHSNSIDPEDSLVNSIFLH